MYFLSSAKYFKEKFRFILRKYALTVDSFLQREYLQTRYNQEKDTKTVRCFRVWILNLFFFEKTNQLTRQFKIMEQQEQLVEGLNDLIQIHNDRINTYRKIHSDLNDFDSDIERICQRIVRQSELHIAQLVELVEKLHSSLVKTHGKAYRIWLKLKGIYMEKDRVSILNSFDFNEEAAEKAYDYAVAEIEAPDEVKNVLLRQQSSLKITHDIIKEFNDREFMVAST